jgi:hypothetical protein
MSCTLTLLLSRLNSVVPREHHLKPFSAFNICNIVLPISGSIDVDEFLYVFLRKIIAHFQIGDLEWVFPCADQF